MKKIFKKILLVILFLLSIPFLTRAFFDICISWSGGFLLILLYWPIWIVNLFFGDNSLNWLDIGSNSLVPPMIFGFIINILLLLVLGFFIDKSTKFKKSIFRKWILLLPMIFIILIIVLYLL